MNLLLQFEGFEFFYFNKEKKNGLLEFFFVEFLNLIMHKAIGHKVWELQKKIRYTNAYYIFLNISDIF